MVEYCYFRGCLRKFVLDYFGDVNRMRRCGTCSSCDSKSMASLRPAERNSDGPGVLTLKKPGSRQGQPDLERSQAALAPGTRNSGQTRGRSSSETRQSRQRRAGQSESGEAQVQRTLSEPETVVVRKVLSCIARLNDRFGKGTIARVLAGASSGEISSHALGGLPTFGALRDIELPRINRYIKALILAGCVEVNAGSYPTLRLSEFGREVMHGRAQARLDFGETREI
jgi:superfamily II DNA helicase RecQ